MTVYSDPKPVIGTSYVGLREDISQKSVNRLADY